MTEFIAMDLDYLNEIIKRNNQLQSQINHIMNSPVGHQMTKYDLHLIAKRAEELSFAITEMKEKKEEIEKKSLPDFLRH